MQLALFLMQSAPDPDVTRRVMMALFTVLPLVVIVILAIVIVPFWFICKKAGFSPWLSLLNIIPLGNLVLIYVLAFADWKVVPAPMMAPMGYPPPPPPQQPPPAQTPQP